MTFLGRSGLERELADLGVHAPAGDLELGAPPTLRLVKHFHVRMKPDVAAGEWVAESPASRLTPEAVDPGFVDRVSGKFVPSKLDEMLKQYVSEKHSQNAQRMWLALVDLTDDKLFKPDLAGWRSTAGVYGASVPKILALLALFQLRSDLNDLAQRHTLATKAALLKRARQGWAAAKLSPMPKVNVLLRVIERKPAPVAVEFSEDVIPMSGMRGLVEDALVTRSGLNHRASQLILLLGFPYIASVTWQYGLRHPRLGGMWLRRAYSAATWDDNPVRRPPPVFDHTVSALSVAAFFTLLGQRRLVSPESSVAIRDILARACNLGWEQALFGLGKLNVTAHKCGYFGGWNHVGIYAERDRYRYVAVALTKSARLSMRSLIQDLDCLIRRNNGDSC